MSKTIRAIVVEDERLPRLVLLKKLEQFRPQVEVVDSCDNYDDALQSILTHKPDLLLLDIQLHGYDSIQMLNDLKRSITLPYIIFTTAYDERKYLMSAIKLQAVDYLIKPIDQNELALAIAKLTAKSDATDTMQPASPTGKIVFRTANGKLFLDKEDIAYIKADGNYACVVTFQGQEMVLESLATMERHLDKAIFVRADRQTIVNLASVFKLNVKRRTCLLKAKDGTTLEVELSKSGITFIADSV